jgi:8-oxo-dGTP pyrophosphatase MutT (NUDIX family)
MKKIFENWRKCINEYGAAGMGGNLATLQGAGRVPMAKERPATNNNDDLGDDLDAVVKAVVHGNNLVLLLKNKRGWDLPGGHMKQSENKISALQREVFEETGLNITDIQDVHMQAGNKHFFCVKFLTDDVTLSDEHSEYKFFNIEDIKNLKELSSDYKKVILSCLGVDKDIEETKLLITINL